MSPLSSYRSFFYKQLLTRGGGVLFFLLVFTHESIAQANGGQSNWWYYGYQSNMNFNGLTPNPVNNSPTNIVSSPVTMSDKSGNLLFFGKSDSIWDASGQLMQNGNIGLKLSTGGHAVISLPKPCDSNKYYIFQADTHLYYSVIDMSLNNGLGGIIPGQKAVPLSGTDSLISVISATKHSNNRDYWILTRSMNSNKWEARLLTPNGIDTVPVVSHQGLNMVDPSVTYESGTLKFSNSGNKVAFTNNREANNQCRYYFYKTLGWCTHLGEKS